MLLSHSYGATPCQPPYHGRSQHKRGQQERHNSSVANTTVLVGRGSNTVKTQSRCVATPGAHTTIFLGSHNNGEPQQWGDTTGYLWPLASLLLLLLYNCPNRATQRGIFGRLCKTATTQDSTNGEQQLTAGEWQVANDITTSE